MPPVLQTREDRASELWLHTDLHSYLSSATKVFGDEETLAMFKAMHKGLAILSMQSNLTGAERLSSISPHEVDPYKRTIWLPIQGGPGVAYQFSKTVHRLVGVKRTPVVVDELGQVVDDWLEEGEDYEYDSATSTITFSDEVTGVVDVVTGYEQKDILDDLGDPRYSHTPVMGEAPITGKSGYPLVDELGDPITQPIIASYTQDGAQQEDDLDQPILEEQSVYRIPTGTYYVVEAVQENDYMWSVTAASIGFAESLRPLGFTPAHVPFVLQCVEEALQFGFSSGPFRQAMSALAGNPFAYGSGRILAHELEDGLIKYVVVEDYENEAVYYCEIPDACAVKSSSLKPVGRMVTKFESLLKEETVEIQFEDSHQDALWGPPVAVHQLSNEIIGVGQKVFGSDTPWDESQSDARDLFALEIGKEYPVVQTWDNLKDIATSTNLKWGDSVILFDREEIANFASGRPILLRNIKQNWSKVYSARRSHKGRIFLDGYLPDLNEGEVLFAQALIQDADSTTRADIRVWAPALLASLSPLEWLVNRVLPAQISAKLTLTQQMWDRLYCTWEEHTGAWSKAKPGLHWENAVGVIWNFNNLKWTLD